MHHSSNHLATGCTSRKWTWPVQGPGRCDWRRSIGYRPRVPTARLVGWRPVPEDLVKENLSGQWRRGKSFRKIFLCHRFTIIIHHLLAVVSWWHFFPAQPIGWCTVEIVGDGSPWLMVRNWLMVEDVWYLGYPRTMHTPVYMYIFIYSYVYIYM